MGPLYYNYSKEPLNTIGNWVEGIKVLSSGPKEGKWHPGCKGCRIQECGVQIYTADIGSSVVKLEASYPLLALRCEATYYEDATKPCKAQETERCKELAHLNAAVRPADTALMLRLVAILLPCSGHYMLVVTIRLIAFLPASTRPFHSGSSYLRSHV